MRKEQGITLVSLVVTIIVLIILAGVSINLTLGENGIITTAKQAKEKTEQAKLNEEVALNELYMQIEEQGGEGSNIYIGKLVEFKKEIADYIEEAGGVKPEYTADTMTFRDSIKGIVKEVTKGATATAEDITEGKTAWVNGELIEGIKEENINNLSFITAYIKYYPTTSVSQSITISNAMSYSKIFAVSIFNTDSNSITSDNFTINVGTIENSQSNVINGILYIKTLWITPTDNSMKFSRVLKKTNGYNNPGIMLIYGAEK